MRVLFHTGWISVVLFLFITISTAKCDSASDGHDYVGYPMHFYHNFEGKCVGESRYAHNEWKFFPLVFDMVVTMLSAFLLVWVLKKKYDDANRRN
jgi:hypothetical protein